MMQPNSTGLNSTGVESNHSLAELNSDSMEAYLSAELHDIEVFEFYYIPILVFLGTIGNGLSVYVFFKTKLKKLSSSYYLSALAIADSAFLLALIVVWLVMVQIDFFNQEGVCQTMVYLTSVSGFLSIWLVVAFTVERFVAVRYPLLRQSVCTTSRAKIVIGLMVSVSLLLYSPLLMFAKPIPVNNNTRMVCMVDHEWEAAAGIFNYIDTVLTFVVPVMVIVVLNVCISKTIWMLAKVRRGMTYNRTAQLPAFEPICRKGIVVRNKRRNSSQCTQNKVTKMLLFVSTVCLCLNLPSYVLRLLTYILEDEILNKSTPFKVLVQFSQILSYTNFGVNFALYCISGQNFRKALRAIVCKRRLQREEIGGTAECRTNSSGLFATSKKRRTHSQ